MCIISLGPDSGRAVSKSFQSFMPQFVKWEKEQSYLGSSLAVQWLEFCAFTAEGPGSILGWGTKIPQATWYGQKKKRIVLPHIAVVRIK